MRTVSVLVAALVAASSVAGHERDQEPRKIYYPRHIKRQFTNATITSFTSSPPAESDEASSSPTKRQSAGILNSLDLDPPSVPAVTTVVVQSTVYVSPGETPPSTPRNGTSPDPSSDSVASTPTDDPLTSPSDTKPIPATRPTADPTSQLPVTEDDKGNSTATVEPATSDPVVSVLPTTTSSTGIVLAPTGIVTSSETTPAPAQTSKPPKPLDPIESIVSNVVSVITSVLPPLQNATDTAIIPDPTSVVTIPTVLPSDVPGTGIVPSVTTDTPLPSGTGTPPESTPPPPPPSSTPIVDPPLSTNTTAPPPESTPPPTPTDTTVPPPSSTPPPPPPPSSTIITSSKLDNTTNNLPPSTPTATPTATDDGSGVTSIPHLGTVTNSQSWLPTTILVDPTQTTVNTGLAPTTATGIPTGYPKAITPETGLGPVPLDTELIQVAFLEGYNYPFVSKYQKAAAQVFTELPNALSYAAGISRDKILVRKLIPLDTTTSMGYITTLAIVTYPKSMIEALKIDIKFPNSALYNNPNDLTYNFTKQINPAIDIIIGSEPEDSPGGGTGSDGSAPGGTNPNGDPFSNEGAGGKTSSQQGTTAGIVGGAVFVAAAYGAVMFVIARRYKKKKQAHRRASSISNPSDMQQSPRSSPALMGGALLSRDFTGYGGVAGGVAGGRNSHNSHGSGRSGMGNSARTQYISAPVAQENSLGWN